MDRYFLTFKNARCLVDFVVDPQQIERSRRDAPIRKACRRQRRALDLSRSNPKPRKKVSVNFRPLSIMLKSKLLRNQSWIRPLNIACNPRAAISADIGIRTDCCRAPARRLDSTMPTNFCSPSAADPSATAVLRRIRLYAWQSQKHDKHDHRSPSSSKW